MRACAHVGEEEETGKVVADVGDEDLTGVRVPARLGIYSPVGLEGGRGAAAVTRRWWRVRRRRGKATGQSGWAWPMAGARCGVGWRLALGLGWRGLGAAVRTTPSKVSRRCFRGGRGRGVGPGGGQRHEAAGAAGRCRQRAGEGATEGGRQRGRRKLGGESAQQRRRVSSRPLNKRRGG